ncbi:MAG TPA: aldo/keto reductase [Chitinophagaceae bacterium]|jgi:aryl-alcohol dehydrogenase-like predicted oxidoreductase|nr:aldo/keto reductase [Chitinophagaceae bacterium]
MKRTVLGKTGWELAPLAFGGNVLGWTVNEADSFRLLDAFTDAGFSLIDTANSYSSWVPGNKGGESETIIGNWLKRTGKRREVLIATKVGSDMGGGKPDLTRRHILEQVEDSLRRLQTDYIDLYQSHFDDPGTPVEETMETFALLVQQGKVRALGASNLSPERIRASLDYAAQLRLPAYVTLQPEYNLYDRSGFEKNYAPLCAEAGLAVLPYFGLARGFLTGKYRKPEDAGQSVRGGTVVAQYLNERGHRILAALDEVSGNLGAPQAAVALAWLMAQPHVAAPVASATSTAQLEALVTAARLELDAASLEALNAASSE